jgi:hypothetical protein
MVSDAAGAGQDLRLIVAREGKREGKKKNRSNDLLLGYESFALPLELSRP